MFMCGRLDAGVFAPARLSLAVLGSSPFRCQNFIFNLFIELIFYFFVHTVCNFDCLIFFYMEYDIILKYFYCLDQI